MQPKYLSFDTEGERACSEGLVGNGSVTGTSSERPFELLHSIQQQMTARPSYYDAGKRLYIDHMEGFCEKLKIFTFRYELSSDPYAKARATPLTSTMRAEGGDQESTHVFVPRLQETIRMLNEKLALGGLTIRSMTEQMGQMLTLMRTDLEKEARKRIEWPLFCACRRLLRSACGGNVHEAHTVSRRSARRRLREV